MKNPNQIGGQGVFTAIKQREDAMKRYLTNPKFCQYCQKLILPSDKQKFCEIKKKKFCNASCSASFNNLKRVKKEKPVIPRVVRKQNLENLTKGFIFEKAKNWQSARSCIRKHASNVFNSLNITTCVRCGYDKHIEVCHIKPVSSFSNESLMKEINDPNNLIGLCPNCHWEFDNGLLSQDSIKKDAGVGFEPTEPDLMRVGSEPPLPAI